MNQLTISETVEIGRILAQSGFFQDARGAAQAVAKILAGQEMGFGPMAAMTGIYIVKGKVVLSANLLAAAVKRSGKYGYKLHSGHPTDEVCSIDFYQDGEKIGTSTFSLDDARKAGLGGDNWKKYPRNMLFARALSNGAKWFCPDILGGPLYTPDEFGLVVDEEGEVIEGAPAHVGAEEQEPSRWPDRPWDPETLRAYMHQRSANDDTPPDDDQFRRMHAALSALTSRDDNKRRLIQTYLFGVDSSKKLNAGQAEALRAWAGVTLDEETGEWIPNGYAVQEMHSIFENLRRGEEDDAT